MNKIFRKIIISIELAIKNLRINLGRTVLTLVGIVIGITSVIVIMSSGQGVKGYVLGQLSSMGNDMIQIKVKVPATGNISAASAIGQAQGITITTLKVSDAEDLRKVPNVENLYAGTIDQEITSYQGLNKQSMIFAVSATAPQVDANIKLAQGDFFTQADDDSLAQVAVIGSNISRDFFGANNAVGKMIKIKDQNYRVIGVLQSRGSVSMFNFDDMIYLPVQTTTKKILGVDYIKFIFVKIANTNLTDLTVSDLENEMSRLHKITDPKKEDFSVVSVKEAQDIVAQVFNTINILLLALTSISLIVGGVGIMNVMYVSVVERTFEIGLRKAVGAKPKDILKQFLFEAVFITFAGGIVGIVLGFLFSALFTYIFSIMGFNLELVVSWQNVALAAGFSIIVGIVFGYYPASVASKLSPMEALRKE